MHHLAKPLWDQEDDGAFVHVDLDDVLPPVPDAQAYRDGEQVLYFSVSHQKVVPAFIAGPGVFLDEHPEAQLPQHLSGFLWVFTCYRLYVGHLQSRTRSLSTTA